MVTQDNLRCARCCMVIFEVFSEMMQELLKNRHLSAQRIYDLVMNDVPFLQKLRDKEKEMLQSLRTLQVFSELDASIIYKIVTYFRDSNIIPTPTVRRWGKRPLPTDTDIGDDVERIHFARNDFAHKTNAAINETEFEEFFHTFIDVGIRVDSYLRNDPNFNHARRIRDFKTSVLDTETAEQILEQRIEIEQLKRELVIQENRKEIEIYCGKGVEAVIQRLKDLKEVGYNSLIRLKLIMENVVDSDEIVTMFRSLVTEINLESTVELISIETQCIELIVNINTYYLTNKDLLLGAVTKFLHILIEKQALIWKGNTVTVVIVIDEVVEEQEVFDDTPLNSSSDGEDTRHFELEEHPSNKGSLVLDLGIKARDLRDGKLNQHLTSFIENLLRKSNGRELFEEKHVKASLVVEDACDSAGEADNDVLLKLADQQLNKGNPQDAKVTIGQVEARLDQDFHVIRTSKLTGHTENMMEEYSKRIGIQYKMCSLLLMKIPGSVFDAVRCFYIGLVCYGNPDLYKYMEISPEIWRRIYEEVMKNVKIAYHVMADLVEICVDLHKNHLMIILFMAFELATKFVQLLSKLPENSKTNFYLLVHRCWLICVNCHYMLKEFNKAVEVLTLSYKDPRQYDDVGILELWAFCLLGAKEYYLAKQKVEMAIKIAKTEIQKSRFQNLEEYFTLIIQRRETQSAENYDSEDTSTKYSGYNFSSRIDLVGSTNIYSEAELDNIRNELSDTRNIADCQYSDSTDESLDDFVSPASAKSRKKKNRRKTKTLQRMKEINSSRIVSSSMPLHHLPVSHSLSRTHKWRNDHLDMKGQMYQNVNYDESKGDSHSEIISDKSSTGSFTTISLAGLSADEFSGSEYDVSDSSGDWYESASDFDEEGNDLEEISPDEQTYFQKSLIYHSGQIKARNILESEYFQKGLILSDEFIEYVGSRYFKGKNNIYNEIGNKTFNEQCQTLPRMYKKCTINIESAHQAVCKPVEPKDEIEEICIAGRSKCGQTFTDDTVIVQIYHKKVLGEIHGEVVSLVKRHRYKDIEHPVFVCLLDKKVGYLMKPLCRTVPKLHILHSTVKERFRKSSVEIYNYDADNHTLNLSHCHNIPEGEREQWLFIVAYIKWKPNKIYPLAAVIDVIHCSQNPHDGIRILSKKYQVPDFYEKSTVEGMKAEFKVAKAFNTNDYSDITKIQRVFTIDSSGSRNLDSALSVKMLADRYYFVGIHISDVTSIVKKNDPVDMEAKARCVTFYPGKGFRPFAMLPEPLSESICSLLPDQKRPVISVYFKFDKNGNLAETMPIIQKSIIKSCKQFSYQEVQNILDDKLEEQQIELLHDVRMLYKFAKHLKEMRLGHASFSLPVEIDFSEDENPINTYEARSLVEEFMILTNHSIAKLLRRQYPGSVPLYCQQPPANEVFDNWYNMNHHYIYHVLGLQTMNTPRGKISVFQSPAEGRTRKLTPIQTWVLEEIKDLVTDKEHNILRIKQLIQSDFLHPKQALAYHEWNLFQESSKYVCSSEILTSKDQGVYFSLGKRSYVHFTSPLHRYNDLVVHRLVSAMLKKETDPPFTPKEISDICLSMNDATKRAKQFNIDCKQFRFGRFFKKNPVLFNGFVKEVSDNGLKIIIPGLQNLPIFRKAIQFKSLDVACKPEEGEDVEMLSMTEHEKERKMVTVKWEKRLYSYTHRTCRKPKINQLPYATNSFSPYLRIFPHQNTTFVRYKEHWIRILKFILEKEIDRLMVFLSNFKKEKQTILNISHDKNTISSFKRSVNDVSSEVKQGIIVEHRCRFQVPYHHGQIIQLQMSASLNRGILTPTPQVLDVTENVKFCIDHFDNPIKALLRFAKFPTKSKYTSIDDYVKTWIPIVEMESTINAVHSEDTAVINDIPVEFRGRRGRFVLTKGFCDIRDMDMSSGMTEKLSAALTDEPETIREQDSRNMDDRHGTIMASTIRAAVGTDTDDKLSNTDESENVIIDTPSKEIKTKTLSGMEFIVHEIKNIETEKKSNDGSSQNKKPNYSKLLSPHFLCIKLKRPLTENVKTKIGTILPNKSQYIWVAHGELLKSRSIRRKTYSEKRGCYQKIVEIDLVFKLHKNSPSPPIDRVSSNDKCSIELILKSKVFRRIECYIKLLGEASELAQNIALGHRIGDLDLDYLRLCRTMNYEIDVPGFHANNTKQDTAIMKALNSRFSLIQGPPGTGKTFTGVKLVYLFDKLNKLCQEKDEKRRRVIFCGPSNKSVDLVARMVLNKLGAKSPKIVRMYASAYEYLDFPVPGRAIISSRSMRDAKSDSDLKTKGVVLHHIIRSDGKPHADKIQEFDAKFHADNLIIKENEKLPYEQRKAVKTRLQDIYEYKSLLHTATVDELDNYDVIFCTTSMAGNPRLLTATKGQVAQVIIDECGMCSEPESMVPIIALRATQVVLIGDHKQLRPIIISREASELGLEKSLFERYSNDDSLMTMLEQQYRMNTSICEFPSRMFYDGKLKTAHENIGRPRNPLKMWRKSNNIPRVFCHVEGEEETLTVKTKEGNEQFSSNKKEIEQVLKVFRHMVTVEGVNPETINVMSQYNAQCTALRVELKEKGFDKFNVTTVVSSQGGEWDYVIFSLVRSLPKYMIEKNPTEGWCIQNLGFITDRHQINVALTRAKKGLVIIGNKNLLVGDEVWRKLLEDYEMNDCIFDARQFP